MGDFPSETPLKKILVTETVIFIVNGHFNHRKTRLKSINCTFSLVVLISQHPPNCNKFLVKIKEGGGFGNIYRVDQLLPTLKPVQFKRDIIINVCQQSAEAAASKGALASLMYHLSAAPDSCITYQIQLAVQFSSQNAIYITF